MTKYAFDNFVLTPGAGGISYSDAGRYYSGGGGGVLINGDGPDVEEEQGQGYGGGNGGPWSSGSPGVIVIEIVEE